MKKVMTVIVLTKILLLAVVVLTFHVGEFCVGCYEQNFIFQPEAPITWKTAFKTWDAALFLQLAERGYVVGAKTSQMMPLYPFTIGILKKVTQDPIVTGLILSNVFSFIAFLYLFKFVEQRFDTTVAWRAVMYALVFPMSFFFTRIYAESLFLLLAILFFYHLYQGHYGRAALFAFLLPLTKTVGMLIIFPFFAYILSKGRPGKTHLAVTMDRRFLLVISPLLGLFCSMFIMMMFTGNWFEHFDAQFGTAASRYSLMYMINIPKWFMDNFIYVDFSIDSFRTTLFDRIAFFFYLIFLWWIYKRQDRTHFVYALFMGMVPALSDHFISYGRFLIVIFPLYIQLALTSFNHRRLQVLMFLCQCTLLGAHSLGYWVI